MNALGVASCMLFKAGALAAWLLPLLFGLNILGQLVAHIPLRFAGNLVPKGVESLLFQNTLVGFEVVLIGAPFIVAAMLGRDLSE
jgi:undecaprenyl pyrophosphate phosphatase UppP